ncbi:TonB-dependent receptor [Novosphingobium sp. fls2-241-R2A-195]|uniref:TonB-dependent receptor domain-containing protein n=1 Tax=Novosphingobium sp. fls2-241-R2A-195 TaxID=3040296 RepID=UPI00254BA582|nr:TonB-dependent receptor [Novosphingobium sp. fls2-241-R2A-195]
MMNAFSLMLAGVAAASSPTEESVPTGRQGQEKPPAIVPAGPDPVYPADFYKPFQPQTALDMLERTPGFLLSEGTSVRGFGNAAGNVLIDGQRPTVKGGGITEVLRRIAASRVERVVLLRGSDAAEAQGQTLVANVILRTDAGGSGNAALTMTHTADGIVSPAGRVSFARRVAGWQTSIELSGEVTRYPTDGVYLDRDATGTLTSTRREHIRAKAPEYGLALSTSGAVAGGTLTVNLRLNKDGYSSARGIDIFKGAANGSPDGRRDIAYDENGRSGELGLDWTRRLGSGWTAKLVGLGRVERYVTDEDYVEADYRGLSSQRETPSEFVARATVTREGDHSVRPEFGGEVAYNRLSSLLDYAEDTGSGLMPVALANADTRVSELRGEAFANITVKFAPRLALEAGMAVEFSRIRVSGEAAQEQSLSYLKPSAALVWSPSGSTQLRLGVRRTVDQLDFADFAASVNQADGRPLGGNSGLRPARVTRALARLDHRWGKGGAIAVEAYHQWHTGLLGYLVLDSGDQALGTIGDARQWGVSVQGTLPLDAVLRGARLTLDGTWRGSRLSDPITGKHRAMDDIAGQSVTAEFRHDVPALKSSWGVNWTAPEEADVFYTGEVLRARSHARWGGYIETTALAGFKTTLTAKAINGQDSSRWRRFYSPSRAGAYTGSEERNQKQGVIVSMAVVRAF